VVVAEGAVVRGLTADNKSGRLGGIGEALATSLSSLLKQEVRSLNLGHLVRGGAPVASDRLLGLRLGSAAVRAVLSGTYGVLVGWDGTKVIETPLEIVAANTKSVPLDSDLLETASGLGIYIGDRV
jgi:6-phosphofructokinase 1